ncbi:MAG TPA: hypothetical protein VMH33_06935 [Solirubrobacterales bacterium]|nr:hypothetical protein [Solirubrobacterales bacterium]
MHYGSLYGERAPFKKIFEELISCGRWERILLRQRGPDWTHVLDDLPPSVFVEHMKTLPWAEVQTEAEEFDAAVVFGWLDPNQMPSKAVQYLTLPIPRLAITTDDEHDSLAEYATRQPGWVVLRGNAGEAAALVSEHISRPWTYGDLASPYAESWPAVEEQLARFVTAVIIGKI